MGIINCVVLGITCDVVIWYSWETKKLRHASQRQVLYTVIESKLNNLIISLGTHDAATFCFASIEVIKGRMKEMGNTIKTKSNESLLVSDK
ncbi:MAG: hypothetical protein GY739_21910, partial [Mesoflavibacter sp.]|nr:hypothetical protein [Mesoflavibacter sp.]